MRAAIAFAPVALLATSCGGKSTTPLGAAVEKTAAQARYHVVMRSSIDRSGVVQSVGDYDGQTGSFEVRYGHPGALKEIVNRSTLYLSSDAPWFANQVALPRGKHWISVDLKFAMPPLGQGASQAGLSPLGAARLLSKSNNVDGTHDTGALGTTHYAGTVPAPRAESAQVRPEPLSVDVWIGKNGYVRQVRTVSTFQVRGFPALKTTTVCVLSRFGENIRIQLPPVVETVDRTQMYAKALTANGGK